MLIKSIPSNSTIKSHFIDFHTECIVAGGGRGGKCLVILKFSKPLGLVKSRFRVGLKDQKRSELLML